MCLILVQEWNVPIQNPADENLYGLYEGQNKNDTLFSLISFILTLGVIWLPIWYLNFCVFKFQGWILLFVLCSYLEFKFEFWYEFFKGNITSELQLTFWMSSTISRVLLTVPLNLPCPLSTGTIPGRCGGDHQGLAISEREL